MKRIVVITGGAGEIGTCLATRYVAEGAEVHLVDRSDSLEARAAALGATAHRIDVTDDEAVSALASLPGIDVLVNGVGVWPVISIDDLPPARWRQLIDVNLNSAYSTTWPVAMDCARAEARS